MDVLISLRKTLRAANEAITKDLSDDLHAAKEKYAEVLTLLRSVLGLLPEHHGADLRKLVRAFLDCVFINANINFSSQVTKRATQGL
jgi:hypothetical protein